MKEKNKDMNKKVNLNISNILDKLSRKKKIIIMFMMIIISIVGGTFAWFSYQSKKSALVLSIGDLNDSQVIITPYQIRDTMLPVNNYQSGVYSQITVINNNDSKMTMELYYKINNLTEELAQAGLKYTIVQSDSKNGTYTEVLTGNFSTYTDETEIDLFKTVVNSNMTTYYRLYLWLDSSAGNQTTLQNTELNLELNANISRNANEPVLDDGMIPVTISNDGTVKTISSTDSNWYDYSNKEWANAVLVTESSRNTYLNTSDVTVNQSDILGYYVWIPRFRYKIWTTSVSSTGNEQEIGIIFESASSSKVNGTKVGEYLTHPAFTFGTEELDGFWVGKFETSGTASQPTVLPNVQSLREQNVSTQFTTSLKFAGGTLSNGNVTFTGNSTYGLTTNTDSHMMKNSEWGAVAYLSHSIYGINEEIRINNNSNYTTGCGASSANGNETSSCEISYGGATSYPQSTTGNITGIYDMSGGAYEYVMGVLSDSSGNPRSGRNSSYNSGFNGAYESGSKTDGTNFPPSKYYDLYSITSNSSCTLATCGGHALYETAGWYSDYSYFVSSSYPWFGRGGDYSDGANAGAFFSINIHGNSYSYFSWRSVIIPRKVVDVTFNPNGGMATISYTEPGEHIYIVSSTGEYKLEVWGAQGGTGMVDGVSKNIGGYGGYSAGNISFGTNTNLYINVGGKGENAQDRQAGGAGGYNGGGIGGSDSNYSSSGSNEPGGGGGGATHIATTSGSLSTLSSNTDSILIVAGGGGGGAYSSVGGTAGGISGTAGGNTATTGGTQTSGNAFGLGGNGSAYNGGSGAGGSGYYGGLGGTANGVSGAGGSGYIGSSLLSNKYMYCYNCTTSDEASTKTYTTENVSSTPIADYAKSGDGAARISTTSNVVETFNSKYDNMPSAMRDGYIFKGWNTKQDGTGEYVTSSSTLISNKSHTLYAIWEEVQTVSITFNPNGGNIIDVIETYTEPGEHIYTVSDAGEYQLEVWGAQGGIKVVGGSSTTGYGGYSLGSVSLSSGINLYINVGGAGTTTSSAGVVINGGYNGGGKGYSYAGDSRGGASGGGATHIATSSGLLSTLASNLDSILIVAGGGGGSDQCCSGYSKVAGSGGGINGGDASYNGTSIIGATQTSGGTGLFAGSFGQGGNCTSTDCAGGGGGYYGGGAKNGGGGYGSGGSGYIGNTLLTDKHMYCYNCTTSNEEGTKTYTTTNVSDTPTANYAKSGNGAARINYISDFNVVKEFTNEKTYGENGIPNAEKKGYVFKGWNTKQDGSGEYVTSGSNLVSVEDHTLYAIWDAKFPTCTISATTNSTTLTATYSDEIGIIGYYFGTTQPTSSTLFASMTSSTSGTKTGTVSGTGTYYFGFKNALGKIGYCSGTSSEMVLTSWCPNLGTPPNCYYDKSVPVVSGSCSCENNFNGTLISGSCNSSGSCTCASGFSTFSDSCSLTYQVQRVYESASSGYSCSSDTTKLSSSYCWK